MQGEDILVSVIVLTYNHEKYIQQALKSILEQKTSFKYEILVGDDASTDRTTEIVLWYAEHFPNKIVAHIRPKNLGATKNLYNLLQCAKGRYIANCEGDDYWCNSLKLQKQIDYLESHPEYSGCTHDCLLIDENGQPLKKQHLQWICRKKHYTIQDFHGFHLPGQSATLVHRNFFLDKEKDYSIIYKAHPMIGDRTIIMILVTIAPIRRFPQIMSCYRASNQNITTRLFCENVNANQMQYELTCKLEKYLLENCNNNIKFTKFKLNQRLKFLIKRLINMILSAGI